MQYKVQEDIALIQELLGVSRAELARETGISVPTLDRWATGKTRPDAMKLDALYSYAYRRRIRLNRYKEQFLAEDAPESCIPLYHGAKSVLEGPLSCNHSRVNNDFGRGFYCGETFEQAAMFVSGFSGSCVYSLTFDSQNLAGLVLGVNLDWMLCVSVCRGKLERYRDMPRVRELLARLESADYVIAPIADNRMFQIIDEFADGEITDVQCEHALSATDLGMQYVLRTEDATSAAVLHERCFLCNAERAAYRSLSQERTHMGIDKAKVARRNYRGQGRYVDEVFDGSC